MAHPREVVATRRNDWRLNTTGGAGPQPRDVAVAAVCPDGAFTATEEQGHGTIRLPVEYVREHVRLGYAASEHGYKSDTVTARIELTSAATTCRGLYVGVTRGRDRTGFA